MNIFDDEGFGVPRDSHPFLRKGDMSISRSGAYGDPYFK